MKKTPRNKGVTLIELIIAIGLVAVICATAYSVLTLGYKTYNSNFTNTTDQQSLRQALLHISKQVKNANTVTVDAAAKTITVDGKIYKCVATTLQYNGNDLAYNITSFTPTINGKLISVVLSSGEITVSTKLATN